MRHLHYKALYLNQFVLFSSFCLLAVCVCVFWFAGESVLKPEHVPKMIFTLGA